MGQKSSRLRVSDVEERLLEPAPIPTGEESEEVAPVTEKSHSSVGRLLSLGIFCFPYFAFVWRLCLTVSSF